MSRFVHIGKSLLALLVVHSGVLKLIQALKSPRILVVAYHRVTPDDEIASCDYPAMHVSKSHFALQLEALQKLYRVISMSELRAILERQAPLEEHVAVITFDDGYRDNYQNAMPILQALNLSATFFLSYRFVEEGQSFWFDDLADFLHRWDAWVSGGRSPQLQLPDRLLQILDSPNPFADRLRMAVGFMKALPEMQRGAVMRTLRQTVSEEISDPDGERCRTAMLWEEVGEMQRSGMDFGAHGMSHAILTRMPAQAARNELSESMVNVARRLGKPVEVFAYPNGDANLEVARLAREAGARLAFTMEPRENRPGDPSLRLGRRNMCDDTSRSAFARFSRSYFWCEITGVFDFVLRRKARQGVGHA